MAAEGPTALIADDEPLLRQGLTRMLQIAWPELSVVALARNGREAVELFERHSPDICFLDVQMPGMDGVGAARMIGRRAHIVFVTAFTDYAVQAFDAGALDYLVKPIEASRLSETVARIRERMPTGAPQDVMARLEELAARLDNRRTAKPLRRLKASSGNTVHLIDVERIAFMRSDEKYTAIFWSDADGSQRESLVRMPLKELVAAIATDDFVQVHRSYAVNLASVECVARHENETGTAHLRGMPHEVPISRSCLHIFRQM